VKLDAELKLQQKRGRKKERGGSEGKKQKKGKKKGRENEKTRSRHDLEPTITAFVKKSPEQRRKNLKRAHGKKETEKKGKSLLQKKRDNGAYTRDKPPPSRKKNKHRWDQKTRSQNRREKGIGGHLEKKETLNKKKRGGRGGEKNGSKETEDYPRDEKRSAKNCVGGEGEKSGGDKDETSGQTAALVIRHDTRGAGK